MPTLAATSTRPPQAAMESAYARVGRRYGHVAPTANAATAAPTNRRSRRRTLCRRSVVFSLVSRSVVSPAPMRPVSFRTAGART